MDQILFSEKDFNKQVRVYTRKWKIVSYATKISAKSRKTEKNFITVQDLDSGDRFNIDNPLKIYNQKENFEYL